MSNFSKCGLIVSPSYLEKGGASLVWVMLSG
jgi:hypothetical protein